MKGLSKDDGQNDAACSSMEKTALTLTSLSLHAPHLPFDLVVEILCRLPVKHLIQLCCVCKSWNSLISGDSEFAKKHLRLSTSSHDRRHLILNPTHFSGEFFLCHSPISSILSSASGNIFKQFKYSISEILIKGFNGGNRDSTCDGIVCFHLNNSSAMVCNPSIRTFKILPPLKFPDPRFVDILYTLVRDRFTDNYKVIAVNTGSRAKEVNVHTLGTDYWRRIRDFPGPGFIFPMIRSPTFLNHSVNWLVHAEPYIVSLDLEKESYQILSRPVFDDDDISPILALGTLRGCLSLLFDRRDKLSEVWIMKEYCNDKSWTKLLTVPPVGESDFDCYNKALYISEDDKVLMEFCKKSGKYSLVVYDSINNTFEIPKCENDVHGPMMAQEIYVESLISLW